VDALKQALALHQAGQLDKAEAYYRAILARDPLNANALHLIGVIDLARQRYAEALESINEAIRLKPGRAPFHHNRAAALRALGRFDEAEADYRAALAIAPDYAEAYFNYSATKRFTAEDAPLAAIEKQLQRPGKSEEDRCFLHFAAGKMLDDCERHSQAFAHYAFGNALRNVSFDRQAHAAGYDAIIDAFNRDLLAAKVDVGFHSALPVFVVGMPRSGTTLVEQIIASHPAAHGAGELGDILAIAKELPRHADREPYPRCVSRLPPAIFRGYGEAYVRRVKTLAPSAERIADKMPRNFEQLGLIRLLLPEARIIHCRRHPLDTCLSCYFQRFRAGQEWSYDLADLGFYYRQYRRLMAHWRSVLPGGMLEVDYEALVADPAAVSRSIIEYCGLPWSEACIDFHASARPVSTASNWQVRRPIYTQAIGRWRNYERHLGPLIEALGEEPQGDVK
jgi:tetratricopeptide (TPR) repeat protein